MDKYIVRNFFHNKFGIKLSDADIVKVCAVAGNVDIEAEEERIEKQIEAVRGLLVINRLLPVAISDLPRGAYIGNFKDLNKNLTKHLRTLTETLKPYLGDDKLEV
jgi:hypothetical protein